MKKKMLLLTMLVCFVAAVLCGCDEGPLEKAADKLTKAAGEHSYKVIYLKDRDTLEIDMQDSDDRDFIFETLNKEIEGQDIGSIFFKAKENDFVALYETEIGNLKCKSMKILGLDEGFQKGGCGAWSPILDKVGLVYMDTLPAVRVNNKDDFAALKRVWIKSASLERLDDYPGLEELGICAEMMPSDRLGDAADSEKELTEEVLAKAMEKKESVTFEGATDGRSDVNKVAKMPTLQRILIAPTEEAYVPTEAGSSYLFELQNYKADQLVNPPDTKLEVDPLEGASDGDCVKVSQISLPKLTEEDRWNIVVGFLRQDVKPCYKKGNKMKVKSKSPVIKGKALVYKVDQAATPWKSKKKFYDYGAVLSAKELGADFPLPQLKGDYRTFVYVYPTYVHVGNYDKGTKGYTQTWYCQVFDLGKGIAYAPVEIASKRPPKRFSFYGTPPAKKSGEVSTKKIYKFLKKVPRK